MQIEVIINSADSFTILTSFIEKLEELVFSQLSVLRLAILSYEFSDSFVVSFADFSSAPADEMNDRFVIHRSFFTFVQVEHPLEYF